MRVSDTQPPLTGTLGVDLTGATVKLSLLEMATSIETILPAAVAGTDSTLGLVEHVWQSGETDIAGAYFYTWLVFWPGQQESFPKDSRGLVLSIES